MSQSQHPSQPSTNDINGTVGDVNVPSCNSELDLDAEFKAAEQLIASLGENSIIRQGGNYPNSTIPQLIDGTINWDYSGCGELRPPLPRPDPNQMPADVISFLMKTGKLGEVLNVNNVSSAQPDGYSGGSAQPFSPSQSVKSVFPSQQQNPVPVNSNWIGGDAQNLHLQQQEMMRIAASNNSNLKFPPQIDPTKSKLSPFAAEFVPRQFVPIQQNQDLNNFDTATLQQAIAEVVGFEQGVHHQQPYNEYANHGHFHSNLQQQNYRPRGNHPRIPGFMGYRPNLHQMPRQPGNPRGGRQTRPNPTYQQYECSFESSADRVLTSVTDTIAQLTINPADFNHSVKRMLRVIAESLSDTDTLSIIVTLIVEQSIANKQFSYIGAKLCQVLNENRVHVGDLTIHKCLIQQVQEVFTSSLKSIKTNSSELRERHIGLLYFLAELFVTFTLTGKSVYIFGVAGLEMMQKLINYENGITPDHEMIKNVVNLLKLIGWELERNGHEELKKSLNDLTNLLNKIQLDDQVTLPKTKELIEKLFELQKSNWGRPKEDDTTESNHSVTDPASDTQETFYEQPSSSDDEEFYLDDESEEVNKFYDQFLSNLPPSNENS